jgi:hypothetical protein
LSPDELVELTGLKRHSAQIRWLNANRWTFQVRADGRPSVARAEYSAQMCSGRPSDPRRVGPDLAALDRLG